MNAIAPPPGDAQRVADWLESGVAALCGFIPPGTAATQARRWTAEFDELSTGWGHPARVDGARLLAERAALTGARFPGGRSGQRSLGGACRLLPCADGWLAVSLPRGSDLDLVAPLVEADVSDPWEAVRRFAGARPADEVVQRARLLGLAISRVGEGGPGLRLPEPSAPGLPAGHGQGGRAPLVIDFSALWAGPLCANLLGLAGARVVKVESYGRLDGARRGEPRFYDLLHAGHESICIDPRRRAERAALARLVSSADVVIEASRPRALREWGLSAGEAVRRGTVWVSVTAFGRDPGDRVGFGDDMAAAAGLVALDKESNQPCFVGDAIADPLTGIAAAVAVARALQRGGGQLLDIALSAVVAGTLDGTGVLPVAAQASPPTARPAPGPAALPCADTDRVLASG